MNGLKMRGVLASLSLILGACGDDGGNEGAGSDGSGGSGATTGNSSSMSAGTMGGTSMTTELTTSMGTSADSSGGNTTGEPDECAAFGQAECVMAEGCAPVECRPYLMMGQLWCLGVREFIGCAPSRGCAAVMTDTCESADDAPIYQCRDTCIPVGWMECTPPVDQLMGCMD